MSVRLSLNTFSSVISWLGIDFVVFIIIANVPNII